MNRTLKALSALLVYPSADIVAAIPDISSAFDSDPRLPAALRRQLDALLGELATRDLYDLQERYVLLFDRTRSLSLHLFEHVHGESRDRGQAMIDLKTQYENAGLEMSAAELPDFLPLFLEFVALRASAEAQDLLAQPLHIFTAFAERLRKRESSYEAVFRALVVLAEGTVREEDVSALLAEPDPDSGDLVALDAAWEDEAVTFGPNAGSGCKDALMARVRAGLRPAPGTAGATHVDPKPE